MARRTLLFLLVTLLVALAWVAPALAVTYEGGTEQQRDYAREVIESCWFNYQWTDSVFGTDGVRVVFEEHHDPYWDALPGVAAGLAWWGNIAVDSAYYPRENTFFGEIVAHEWCHQIWFSMPYSWRNKWTVMVSDGSEFPDWYHSPPEHFAESMRVALFHEKHSLHDYVRTSLVYIPTADCREFLYYWLWGSYCGFIDTEAEDDELKAAAGYLYNCAVLEGYDDHSLGQYKPLLKRHIALICQRAAETIGLGWTVPDWLGDYSEATRADVRDNIPGLAWNEERWGEGITRGQLFRLLWRECTAEDIGR